MKNRKKLSGGEKNEDSYSTSLWRHVRVMKRLSKEIRVQSEKHEDARYVET